MPHTLDTEDPRSIKIQDFKIEDSGSTISNNTRLYGRPSTPTTPAAQMSEAPVAHTASTARLLALAPEYNPNPIKISTSYIEKHRVNVFKRLALRLADFSNPHIPERIGYKPHVPLALPRTIKPYKCVLCDRTSKFVCNKCSGMRPISKSCERNPCYTISYCGKLHAKMDTFHPLVCSEILKWKNNQLSELVHHRDARDLEEMQTYDRRKKLVEYVRVKAMKVYAEGDLEKSKQAAAFLVKMAKYFMGPVSQITVSAEIHLAYCWIQLKDTKMTKVSLFNVEISMNKMSQKSGKPPLTTCAEVNKINGLVNLCKGNIREAIENFSEEIYCYTKEFGTQHWRFALAYARLSGVFRAMGKVDISSGMYRHVTDNWAKFLTESILQNYRQQMKCDQPSRLNLTQKNMTVDPQSLRLESFTAFEGLKTMREVLDFWHTDGSNNCQPTDVMLTAYAIAMLHFSRKSQDEAVEYSKMAVKASKHPSVVDSRRDDVLDSFNLFCCVKY